MRKRGRRYILEKHLPWIFVRGGRGIKKNSGSVRWDQDGGPRGAATEELDEGGGHRRGSLQKNKKVLVDHSRLKSGETTGVHRYFARTQQALYKQGRQNNQDSRKVPGKSGRG